MRRNNSRRRHYFGNPNPNFERNFKPPYLSNCEDSDDESPIKFKISTRRIQRRRLHLNPISDAFSRSITRSAVNLIQNPNSAATSNRSVSQTVRNQTTIHISNRSSWRDVSSDGNPVSVRAQTRPHAQPQYAPSAAQKKKKKKKTITSPQLSPLSFWWSGFRSFQT